MDEEVERIDKYKEYKKLNADTWAFTSNLYERIAKSSKVGKGAFGLLGSMQFDDYSYGAINPLILTMKKEFLVI